MSLTPPFPVQSTEQVQPEVFYRLLDDLFSEGVARSTDLQVVQHGAGTILSVDVDPGDGYVQFDSPYGGTRRVRLTAQSGGPQPLVLSGNEVTDAIRTRGPVIEGDGLSADSSTGIWKGTTNLITNGGLESNTTGWVAGATWTIARSTEQAKFGLSSLKCTFSTAGGDITEFPITLTAAKHAASLWLYIPTSWDGGQIALKVVGFTGATGTLEVNANMSLRDQWQRVPLSSFTPDAGDLTGTLLVVYSTTDPTAGRFIYVDGAQIEAREVATPYVETDGGTASRGNARVQGPRDALDVTQGWIALRMRRGFPNTNVPGSGNVFDVIWSDNVGAVNDQISIYIAGSGDIAARLGDTSGVQSVVISDTFAIGDITTLIITWTATILALSVDGSVFSTSSRTKFPDPSLLASTFNIGSSHNDLWTYSDVFWAACGKGTLSNADAATIHGFGNVDPLASDFPGAAALSLLWPAVTSALASDEWARGFQTPDATDPRIDRVVALVEDSDLDSSGHRRWALDVAPGSAVAGATLGNLLGAGAVPANALLLANVKLNAAGTAVLTADIDTATPTPRPRATIGSGRAVATTQNAGMVKLFDSTLGAPGTFDFNNIASTYHALLLVGHLRGTVAAVETEVQLRFNADAGAAPSKYGWAFLAADGTTVSSGADDVDTDGPTIIPVPGASAAADLFSAVRVWIPAYADSVRYKAATWHASSKSGTTSGSFRFKTGSIRWDDASPITRVQVGDGSAFANLATGSRLTLWGLTR